MTLPAAERYNPAFGRVPLAFGVAEARALPGPILVELMVAMGEDLSPSAAKSMLHRMVTFGMLDLARSGRVGIYRLAGTMLEGYEAMRDNTRLRSPEPWSGSFHTVIYDIPEEQRSLRDKFRNRAFRRGYRQLRPGVLISPTDETRRLSEVIDRDSMIVSGWLAVELGEARQIAAVAWDLDRHRSAYEALIARVNEVLDGTAAPEGSQALRVTHELMQPLADVRFSDGDLPRELLPPDWPATELSRLMGACFGRLGPSTNTYVRGVVERSPHRHLIRPDLAHPGQAGPLGDDAH